MSIVEDRILSVFREVLDIDDLILTDETSAKDVPGWDSLAQVKLVIAIEEEFNMKFTTHDVAEMQCIGDLKKVLRRTGNG
jgi:acyl carrier protein